MKKFLVLASVVFAIIACNSGDTPDSSSTTASNDAGQTIPAAEYDTARGKGKFMNVELSETLDKPMADKGKVVYEVKCASCHKLNDERLVGPGWAGVTERNTPEWIMNFVTNVDEMLTLDPKAQAQLELCLVRMPNQNLSDDDARSLLEFMRENDGVK